MSEKTYTFEQPLIERVRILLRIETLIHRLDYLKKLDPDIASYQALLTLLEITALLGRGDVKQEIIKELERHHKVLNGLISNQNVNKSRLELTLSKLKNAIANIHGMDGKPGEHLKKIDFLLAIKQRSAIPGGSCDFDLPELRYWLNQTYKNRLKDINRWAKPYYQLYDVIQLLLSIIRDSADAELVTAKNGFFQEVLDRHQPNQMLRIELSRSSRIFPEISAGKHRYTIRFLRFQDSFDELPIQLKEDIEFKLYRCVL